MRQVWILRHGLPNVLQLREAPDPIPSAGEVRVRVEACGVGFADVMGRMGLDLQAPRPPYVPGFEIAGRVDLVGQGVPDLQEGDAVFGFSRFHGYSDVVCVPHQQIFKRWQWMSAEQGAALPLSYLLAYQMLMVMGSLRPGDTVLIHGAGGGVGLALLDICKIVGATTFGTASPHKHLFLQERGLDHAIDYRNRDYERVVNDLTGGRGVQLVLDCMGGVDWQKNYRLLRPSGRLIHYGVRGAATGLRRSWLSWWLLRLRVPFYTPFQLMADNKGVMGVGWPNLWHQMDLQRQWMRQIITWYDEALFRPHIDRSFRLEQAAEAHMYLQERKNVGKVLLIP
jgi:NADPH:quinone reductase-like Zn-dependent oxidoreductase